ncbi:MAG: transcriptional activator ChrR [Caulobacter sp.]|nr:transcriptional activator ChrR [Caulobacter sp.]
MNVSALFPDASDPGLKLMARTAAVLRTERQAGADEPPLAVLAAGGAFLEREAPMALEAGALDQAFARIDALETIEARVRAAATDASRRLGEMAGLPDPAREAAFAAIEAGERWTFAGLGIRRLLLPVGSTGRTELIRLDPGHGAPRHDHEGEEYTLVLTGAYHDGHRLYQPGDLNVGEPGFVHQPTAQQGGVCFALAVSWGEPKFEGVFGLMQKITRH